MIFSKKLITWYLQNKRSMPWRETNNPYHIWLSEIILQQTKVAQGLPYYRSFIEAFPTVSDLAKASEQEVLKLWQGLGYYSRARNLHITAKHVAYDLNGIFPVAYKDLLLLKGVGDYTASAIASICYKEAVPVVDGNVYRVLSRYFDIDTPINNASGARQFKQLAIELMDHEDPANYNQAIMEFGALQCKPKKPDCNICPLCDSCEALKNQNVDALPVKLKTTKVKKRYFNYLVFSAKDNQTIISQRVDSGIWKGLYEFPLIESGTINKDTIVKHPVFEQIVGDGKYEVIPYYNEPIVHKLSHQHLYTWFYIINIDTPLKINEAQKKIKITDIHQYPVPVLLSNFINVFFK